MTSTRDPAVDDVEGAWSPHLGPTPTNHPFIVELAWKLLSSLPRARLAAVQRRIHPLLQFDIIGVREYLSVSITNWLMAIHRHCRLNWPSKYSRISPTKRC